MTDKERDQIISVLEAYCDASDGCPHCPINNKIGHCVTISWGDMTDEQLEIAAHAAGIDTGIDKGIDKVPQPDMVNKPNGMTRGEKLSNIGKFCMKKSVCKNCPVKPLFGDKCLVFYDRSAISDAQLDAALNAAGLLTEGAEPDMVNKPNHYQLPGGLECWDILVACFGEEETKIWAKINAFTYLFRHKKKNGEEDIRKALVNLQKYFELGGEAE